MIKRSNNSQCLSESRRRWERGRYAFANGLERAIRKPLIEKAKKRKSRCDVARVKRFECAFAIARANMGGTAGEVLSH